MKSIFADCFIMGFSPEVPQKRFVNTAPGEEKDEFKKRVLDVLSKINIAASAATTEEEEEEKEEKEYEGFIVAVQGESIFA